MELLSFPKQNRKKSSMKDNGWWVKCMAKESYSGEMAQVMRVNISMEKNKGSGNSHLHQKLAIKVLGWMGSKMEQEFLSIVKENKWKEAFIKMENSSKSLPLNNSMSRNREIITDILKLSNNKSKSIKLSKQRVNKCRRLNKKKMKLSHLMPRVTDPQPSNNKKNNLHLGSLISRIIVS